MASVIFPAVPDIIYPDIQMKYIEKFNAHRKSFNKQPAKFLHCFALLLIQTVL